MPLPSDKNVGAQDIAANPSKKEISILKRKNTLSTRKRIIYVLPYLLRRPFYMYSLKLSVRNSLRWIGLILV